MSKYIDAEKLLAEIERLSSSEHPIEYELIEKLAYNRALLEIENAITSLRQEQPEMDEDFFFDEVLKVYDDNNKYPPRSEEELTMLETVARHFYSLRLNARKEDTK